MTLFFRLLDVPVEKKASALKSAVSSAADGVVVFNVNPSQFQEVTGSPFAYWLNDNIRSLFSKLPRFEVQAVRDVRLGASTKYDARFVRLWFEPTKVDPDNWSSYANGGRFGKFFQDYATIVRSGGSFRELASYLIQKFPYLNGDAGWILHSENDYSQPAIGWPLRTHAFSPHALPANTVFSARTYAVYVGAESRCGTAALLASEPVDFLLKVMLGRSEHPEFVTGVVRSLPWVTSALPARLEQLFVEGWRKSRNRAVVDETSRYFILPKQLLRVHWQNFDADTKSIQDEINDIAYGLYEIAPEDRRAIEVWSGTAVTSEQDADQDDSEKDEAEEREADNHELDGAEIETKQLLSWALGVSFGRFDLRLAVGERQMPDEGYPFQALPSQSPGLLPLDEPSVSERRGILVDDRGHVDDLVQNVTSVCDRLSITCPEEESLRRYFREEFFVSHIKMYSKSRRKAPLYWQLGPPSAKYSIWIYAHRFTSDTLFRVQNEYLSPKLAHERKRLESIRIDAGPNPPSALSKDIELQETFVVELQAMLDEVKRVAPLWRAHMDDGIAISFAPLWRLVPHNRAWQKELFNTWKLLCSGDYDWAHMSMHLWPERVVPKCAADRSLAIAHGLEDIFWFEGDDGRWKPFEKPRKSLEELIRERTSVSVKAALKELLEAPEVAAGAKRTRKSKVA